MTKEEILENINYQGEYTKEVKKKLNKLIKKYHPDKNKDDKKTILILYEIKKELESGTLNKPNKKETVKVKKHPNTEEVIVNISFIERIIKILNHQRRMIERNLTNIYKKTFYYNDKIYNESYEEGLLDIEINELNNMQLKLKRVDIVDTLVLVLIIFLISLLIILNNLIFIPFIIIILICEYLYVLVRYKTYLENIERKEELFKEKNKYSKKQKEYEEKLESLRKEEVRLKREKHQIDNDIAFYNHELSKSKNNTKDKEYEKGHSYTKK